MSSSRHQLRRVLALLGTLACPLVLLLLFEIRPPLPALPNSLSSPITLALVRGILDFAAWAAALALTGLLFAHSLRGLFARRPLPPARALKIDPARRQRSIAQARLATGTGQGGFPPPFPLIVRAPAESDRGVNVEVAGAPAREPAAATSASLTPTVRPKVVPTVSASMPELPPPSIALLGPLTVTESKPLRKRLHSRTQELLAYLALHPQGATGDDLVAALAADIDDEQERARLWRAVSQARARLGEVILRVDERYRLNRDTIAVDLDRFEQLLTAADAAADREREQLLERALSLVRGQPLAGSDFPWAAGELRRLQAKIADRLRELGYHRLDNGNPAGALDAAEQAIALESCNEPAHRLAMQAESVLGLRQAISERYDQLCRELDSRFGLEPDRETRLLYRRLLSQDAGYS
jgi:DNA-binding SARP family transcriptional activator